MIRFLVSPEAQQDLLGIWEFIAGNSIDAANRVVAEFYETFASLGRMPQQGYRRTDLTKRSIRFFPNPVRILAVIHGNRNLKRLLKDRSL